jgi:acyl-CoA thioesterase
VDQSSIKSAPFDPRSHANFGSRHFLGQVASAVVDARSFLAMTRVDDDTWRFEVTERLITPGRFLFGGCGLASGLVALEEASERPTVWASAHYLSYAPLGAEVTVKTNLAVVGGHVTQARATTWCEGREVLTVNAALGTGELTAPTPWATMAEVPPPEDCPPRIMPKRFDNSIFNHVETRIALGRSFADIDGTPGSPISALWARVPGHFDPSAATLAIFGDYVSGGSTQPLGKSTMGRSLDNTIRIAKLEPTEWVLCEIHMHALSGGFGQGTALLWSRSGTLLATASQSIAARLWDPED